MADLPALAARLREVTWPSRDLDAELAEAFGQAPIGYERLGCGPSWRVPSNPFGIFHVWDAPAYTASLDAALALVRAAERGLGLEIYTGRDGSRVRPMSAEHTGAWLSCATLPLTICLALVEWRIAHASR